MTRRRQTLHALLAPLALLLGLSLVAAACSDDTTSDATAGSDRSTTTASGDGAGDGSGDTADPGAVDRADDAAYRGPGPYEVGFTSLSLPDREVAVWYPAGDGSTEGVPEATYSQLDALTPELAAAAPSLLPADVDPAVLTVTMTGSHPDVAPSGDGPFPLVLFSHGFGSFRMDASALMAGIASWGFVVAAPEHIERDRAALVTNATVRDPAKDVSVLLDTITLVGDAGGVLEGLADTDRVGAVGHSAGGRAVLTALSEEPIDVAVGWAAAGRADVPAPSKPSMNVAARVDVLVPIEEVEETYAGMSAPKRLVVIDGAGHNSFTDLCLPVKAGNDLIGLAQRIGLPIPEDLAAGGRDGCGPESIDTDLGWQITQHFTVAELRAALGVDREPVGLGRGVVEQFAAQIEYREDL